MTPIRPTLRSLAAEAGVSAMTFSLALRNSPQIGEATRSRLKRLARLRGYRPDPMIAKLMHYLRLHAPARSQANLCGLVQDFPSDNLRIQHFGTRLREGLARRAESLGFAFGTIALTGETVPGQLQRVLLNRGVEGIVLMPMAGQRDLNALLDWSHFSTIAVTASVVAPHFPSVVPNHFDNMLRACRELTRRGYRRLGLAISKDWDERVRHRWTGGITWQNEFGQTLPVPPFIAKTGGPHPSDPRLLDWLSRYKPDAIIVDAIEPSVWRRVLRAFPSGHRPALVTMNWPNAEADAGVDQRAEIIGGVAIELLAGMISRGERGVPPLANVTMIEGDWVAEKLVSRR